MYLPSISSEESWGSVYHLTPKGAAFYVLGNSKWQYSSLPRWLCLWLEPHENEHWWLVLRQHTRGFQNRSWGYNFHITGRQLHRSESHMAGKHWDEMLSVPDTPWTWALALMFGDSASCFWFLQWTDSQVSIHPCFLKFSGNLEVHVSVEVTGNSSVKVPFPWFFFFFFSSWSWGPNLGNALPLS